MDKRIEGKHLKLLNEYEYRNEALCIFDFEGTLIDIFEAHQKSINNYLSSIGEKLISYKTAQRNVMGRLFIKGFLKNNIFKNCTDEKELIRVFNKIWKSHCNNFHLFPGVHDLINELKKKNIRLAIVSANIFYLKISEILHKLNLLDKVDIFCDGRMIIADMFNIPNQYNSIDRIKSIWQLNGNYWVEIKNKLIDRIIDNVINYEKVLYITDDPKDYKAVCNKNIIFVGVLTGVGQPKDFSTVTPHIIPSVNDIHAVLKEKI